MMGVREDARVVSRKGGIQNLNRTSVDPSREGGYEATMEASQ